jgi:hypothetical protein
MSESPENTTFAQRADARRGVKQVVAAGAQNKAITADDTEAKDVEANEAPVAPKPAPKRSTKG